MFPTELLAKPLKHFYMSRRAQCSNSIYGVLSWSIRMGEKRQRSDRGGCACLYVCNVTILVLDKVTPVLSISSSTILLVILSV